MSQKDFRENCKKFINSLPYKHGVDVDQLKPQCPTQYAIILTEYIPIKIIEMDKGTYFFYKNRPCKVITSKLFKKHFGFKSFRTIVMGTCIDLSNHTIINYTNNCIGDLYEFKCNKQEFYLIDINNRIFYCLDPKCEIKFNKNIILHEKIKKKFEEGKKIKLNTFDILILDSNGITTTEQIIESFISI